MFEQALGEAYEDLGGLEPLCLAQKVIKQCRNARLTEILRAGSAEMHIYVSP